MIRWLVDKYLRQEVAAQEIVEESNGGCPDKPPCVILGQFLVLQLLAQVLSTSQRIMPPIKNRGSTMRAADRRHRKGQRRNATHLEHDRDHHPRSTNPHGNCRFKIPLMM